MELAVLGCHGGESTVHRTSSFLVDGRLAIDAGAVTRSLTLAEQKRIDLVLVSHSHMDHVRDLATLADNRCQHGGKTIRVLGTKGTLNALRRHMFNDVLWPDFTKIPTDGKPTIEWIPLALEKAFCVDGYEITPIKVTHTVDSAGFIVQRKKAAIAYTGDTGPTDRFWKLVRKIEGLGAVIAEVSFPNAMHALATASGHHTPKTLRDDLSKFDRPDVPVLIFHIKPKFQKTVERELSKLKGVDLTVLRLGDKFVF